MELTESVDVRLLANLSGNFRTPYEAIYELVDNGLASRCGQSVDVTIAGSGGLGRSLRVITRGGTGMGLRELREFLRWGKEPEVVGLNRYGQGGKAAIGYLARGVRIQCNRFDEAVAYRIEDHDWLARPGGRLKRFVPQEVKPSLPGEAVVQIELVDLRKSLNLKRLERELSWRYRPALSGGVLVLRIGRNSVEPTPMPSETRHDFSCEVTVSSVEDADRAANVMISGWVGVAGPRFEGRGGLRCSAYGRVVLQNEYFGHRGAAFKASLNSLIGEVDLSFVPVVLNKNAFDTGSPAWEAAQAVLYSQMEPIVNQLLRRRGPDNPSDEERLRAMEASDIARRVLERIAATPDRRGTGGTSEGRRPPSAKERGESVSPSRRENQTREAAHPRTQPPAGSVGKLQRKGRVVDWDVRALDRRIRSMIAEEHGRTEIVINSRFPLYEARRGDLLYMLETGLIEELRLSTESEGSIDDLHDQLNEALYLSIEAFARGRARAT